MFCNFLDCNHVVCLYQKSVCKVTVLVCKAVLLSHARPAPFPFPLILFPDTVLYTTYSSCLKITPYIK